MSKKFMVFLVGSFVIVGGLFFWTLYKGSEIGVPRETPILNQSPPAPAVPLPPSVTLSIRLARSGNTLIVDWQNLPGNTIFLNILRRLKNNSTSPWVLWKQIAISKDELSSGSANFDIGSQTFSNYSFSVQTVGNISNQAGYTTGETITWTSPPTTPTVAPTSTPSTTGGQTNSTSTTSNPSTTSTATSTTNSTSTTSSSTASTTTNNGGTATNTTPYAAPSGTPYYNPQIQLSGYGASQVGNFWVQHVDQKIQVGWQNLPAETTAITVLRSSNQGGAWGTILAQSGIDPVGPSTIQLVDDSLSGTFYYELNAKNGSSIIATYGPISLPPLE